MHNSAKILVALYEAKQVRRALEYLESKKIPLEQCHVVALEREVVLALTERGVVHTPVTAYVPANSNFESLYYKTQALAWSMFRHPAMQFYRFRGIALGEVQVPVVQFYLDKLIHAVYTAESVAESAGPFSSVLVPCSTVSVWLTSGPLTLEHINSFTTGFRLYANAKKIPFIELGEQKFAYLKKPFLERVQYIVLSAGLRINNFLVESLVRQKPLKLFVSDYWRHIEPFVSRMEDVELVVMDRREAAKIGLRRIWKYRMRFYHPKDFLTREARAEADRTMESFTAGWNNARADEAYRQLFAYKDISLWPVFEQSLTFLVTDFARRMVTDTISFEILYKTLAINRVLLRAGRGGQYHYAIAAQVATKVGIPSIELQHAGAVIDPRQVFSLLDASYLAAYGTLTREQYVSNHGYTPERIVPIGSPRFDRYLLQEKPSPAQREERLAAFGLTASRPVVLVSVPWETSGLSAQFVSSFEMDIFFRALKRVQQEVPEAQILFKFRANNSIETYRAYLRTLFPDGGMALASKEDFFSLVLLSDMVCSNDSTVVYETMIGKKPLILFPWKEYNFALTTYRQAGLYPASDTELVSIIRSLCQKGGAYQEAVTRGEQFLVKNYCFDGQAAKRLTQLLREQIKPLP
ncbi:MAG: hypothetical protein Q7S26_01620 [bacterium]|nr:hypothetical protein [bacterium]